MIFKLFGKTIQIRSPVRIYNKKEPIYVETASELTTVFGKPNVKVEEKDCSSITIPRKSVENLGVRRVFED